MGILGIPVGSTGKPQESSGTSAVKFDGGTQRGSAGLRHLVSRPIDDGLDVVAIRIEHERSPITVMVGAGPGLAVVGAAGGKSRGMEFFNGLLAGREERDVRGHNGASRFYRGDVEIGVCGAVIHAESDGGFVVCLGHIAQRSEGCGVESDGFVDVACLEGHVVDHGSMLSTVRG